MSHLSIGQAYQLSQPQQLGIDGYYVKNTYHDPRKIKEEKDMIELVSKGEKVRSNPRKYKSKQTFLVSLEKIASKIPAPGQYDIKEGSFQKSKIVSKLAIKPPDRITVFQGIQRQAKKNNFPSSHTYIPKDNSIDSRHKSSLPKAEGATYISNQMVSSIVVPGVGEYNTNKNLWERGGITKWSKNSKSNEGQKQKLKQKVTPSVGSYSPIPLAYNLFQGMDKAKKMQSKNGFGTSRRFSKDQKPVVDASYNIASEWGMKGRKNQDILNKLSSRTSSKSVYY